MTVTLSFETGETRRFSANGVTGVRLAQQFGKLLGAAAPERQGVAHTRTTSADRHDGTR